MMNSLLNTANHQLFSHVIFFFTFSILFCFWEYFGMIWTFVWTTSSLLFKRLRTHRRAPFIFSLPDRIPQFLVDLILVPIYRIISFGLLDFRSTSAHGYDYLLRHKSMFSAHTYNKRYRCLFLVSLFFSHLMNSDRILFDKFHWYNTLYAWYTSICIIRIRLKYGFISALMAHLACTMISSLARHVCLPSGYWDASITWGDFLHIHNYELRL